jgi:mycothiol synthase
MSSALVLDHGLSAARRAEVEQLLERAAAADGFRALNEAADLELRDDGTAAAQLTAADGDRLVGYAQLDPGGAPRTGFLVVDPTARRRGVGLRLAEALLAESAGPVQLLAPTDAGPARALAARLGLVAVRTLLLMRRDLDDLPAPGVPDAVTIRTFRPGQDEAGWLAVNAAAFATHPEQGAVTAADLAARMAEPWFDPAGFFVAERDGRLVGFHWTKEHGDRQGEVYVLGVAPEGHRQGLGRALLLTGLRHLRERGNTSVDLYVEAASAAAVGLYSSYGFTPVGRDVMYAPSPTRASQES